MTSQYQMNVTVQTSASEINATSFRHRFIPWRQGRGVRLTGEKDMHRRPGLERKSSSSTVSNQFPLQFA